ncbi:MAG: hypothetical protein OXF33_00870, partial [Rhodospirillales bacterium]|nr:hypothetical protein [Rhodospirillales bacterium]
RYRIQVSIHPVHWPHLPHGSVRFGQCHALPDCWFKQQTAAADKAPAIMHFNRIFSGATTSLHCAERS